LRLLDPAASPERDCCIAKCDARNFLLVRKKTARRTGSRKFHALAFVTPQCVGIVCSWEGKDVQAEEDFSMTLHRVSCTAAPHVHHFRLPTCPQCGDMLLAPLLAEHVNERLVHNHWVCESCGHAFRKSFSVAARTFGDKPAFG
jgi:hypothetical protein